MCAQNKISPNPAAGSQAQGAPRADTRIADGDVMRYFGDERVVADYASAALWVGLWASEKAVFQKCFARSARLLEIGCGAGRIALGLSRLGYADITGVDASPAMVARAREIAQKLSVPETALRFECADARAMPRFENGAFDGAVFGFNGLMQIPRRAERRAAMAEICRVSRAGARFVFTTHDRANPSYADFWRGEAARWARGAQDVRLNDFGDRLYAADGGEVFMHVPSREEILEDLAATGWRHLEDVSRAQIADEPKEVRDFSDECRFWIAEKAP